MKNGDILKLFVRKADANIDRLVDSFHGMCPNEDFIERFPCDMHATCKDCWMAFLNLDDGLELTIRFPEEGEPHEER